MKKQGIDTSGPKSFLQVAEQFSESSDSVLDTDIGLESENQTDAESQIDAQLENDTDEPVVKQKMEDLTEHDEFTDDDEVLPAAKPKQLKKIPFVFTEVKSKVMDNKIPKVKQDKAILYNPPIVTKPDLFKTKAKILREKVMNDLQRTHVWKMAASERKDERFNKAKYQQGNKNADLFVSFLGYIRDTSYTQSAPLFDKIKKKFVK